MVNTSSRSPMVYMTLGNPGSGKSFFARQFSQATGIPLISIDRLRYELFDAPSYSPEEDKVVIRIADYLSEQFLSAGLSVVIDGLNHTRTRRHYLRQVARQHSARPLVVWVQTDDNTCFDRATRRDRRNPDDKYAKELTEEEYDSMLPKIKGPQHEDYVVISGKHVFNNQLNVVSRKVTAMFSGPAGAAASTADQRRRGSVDGGRIGAS